MPNILTAQRRLALATVVASGAATLVPLVGPAAPAHPRVMCHAAFDGGPRADRIIGNRHENWMCGRGGGDTIKGRNGSDFIYGGPGRDLMHGDLGSDLISGGRGGDTAEGGGGPDYLFGGPGEDFLGGGPGNDQITLNLGGGTVYGDDGNDVIDTDNGYADTVHCGPGTDDVYLDIYDSHSGCENFL